MFLHMLWHKNMNMPICTVLLDAWMQITIHEIHKFCTNHIMVSLSMICKIFPDKLWFRQKVAHRKGLFHTLFNQWCSDDSGISPFLLELLSESCVEIGIRIFHWLPFHLYLSYLNIDGIGIGIKECWLESVSALIPSKETWFSHRKPLNLL